MKSVFVCSWWRWSSAFSIFHSGRTSHSRSLLQSGKWATFLLQHFCSCSPAALLSLSEPQLSSALLAFKGAIQWQSGSTSCWFWITTQLNATINFKWKSMFFFPPLTFPPTWCNVKMSSSWSSVPAARPLSSKQSWTLVPSMLCAGDFFGGVTALIIRLAHFIKNTSSVSTNNLDLELVVIKIYMYISFIYLLSITQIAQWWQQSVGEKTSCSISSRFTSLVHLQWWQQMETRSTLRLNLVWNKVISTLNQHSRSSGFRCPTAHNCNYKILIKLRIMWKQPENLLKLRLIGVANIST